MRDLLDTLRDAGLIVDYDLVEERHLGPSGPQDLSRVTIWVEASRITASALRQLIDKVAASAGERQTGLIVNIGALLERREITPPAAGRKPVAGKDLEVNRG